MNNGFHATVSGRKIARISLVLVAVIALMGGCTSPWWQVPAPPNTGYYLDGGPGSATIDFLDENGHWQHLRDEPLPWIKPIAGFAGSGACIWAQLPTKSVGTLNARIYESGREVATQARADTNCIVELWYPQP